MSTEIPSSPTAPGDSLEVFLLPHEVISCEQAATAKGIPLRNELKTLLITTGSRTYAVHTPGDEHVSLRKVKRYLGVEQAYLLPLEELTRMGLVPGTVCPVIEPVWRLPHLISYGLLDLDFVSTNNGSRIRYFKFSPNILLEAAVASVGDFRS